MQAIFELCLQQEQLVWWQLHFLTLKRLIVFLTRNIFLPWRINTLIPQGLRQSALTASISVPSFLAWPRSVLRSSSSTTDWYSPDSSRFLVSSLGTMCSSPSPPLALLRTMVLKRTLVEPEMWEALKERKERQSSTRHPGTSPSTRERRVAQLMVGTSIITIVVQRVMSVKSKYIQVQRQQYSSSELQK